MRSKALLLAALYFAYGRNAAAIDFSQVNLQPYLVVSYQQFSATELPFPATVQEDQSWFITHGGAVFSTLAVRGGTNIPHSCIFRGIATAAQLAEFRNRLNEARIRGLASCEFVVEEEIRGRTDVTWYSARGRRNDFTIVVGAGTTGLPRCGPAADAILDAIFELEQQVLANPATEVLSQP